MLVVPDIDDVFVPSKDSLFVDPAASKYVLLMLSYLILYGC